MYTIRAWTLYHESFISSSLMNAFGVSQMFVYFLHKTFSSWFYRFTCWMHSSKQVRHGNINHTRTTKENIAQPHNKMPLKRPCDGLFHRIGTDVSQVLLTFLTTRELCVGIKRISRASRGIVDAFLARPQVVIVPTRMVGAFAHGDDDDEYRYVGHVPKNLNEWLAAYAKPIAVQCSPWRKKVCLKSVCRIFDIPK